jgi:hypothetical protein
MKIFLHYRVKGGQYTTCAENHIEYRNGNRKQKNKSHIQALLSLSEVMFLEKKKPQTGFPL